MANFFLKMKHWQLFLLLFSLPFLFMIYVYAQMFSIMSDAFQGGNEPDPTAFMSEYLQLFTSVFPICIGMGILFLLYVFILLRALNNAKPIALRKSMTFPTICLVFPVIYLTIMSIIAMSILPNFSNVEYMENMAEKIFPAIAIIFPCHIFCFFATLYLFYQLGSSLKCVELQRKPRGDEFIGEIILFWMFPIGVWFLQPRINKIFAEKQ